MLKELRTSQLMEYKKLLKRVLDGIDSAIEVRRSLIQYDSVNQYEIAKYDANHDPEQFYHLKLFDMGVSICRLYDSKRWFRDDPDKCEFHFCIRCYKYEPKEKYKLDYKRYSDYVDIGDFDSIDSALKSPIST